MHTNITFRLSKFFIEILLAIVLVFSTAQSYAADFNKSKSNIAVVYNFINDNDYILIIVSDAIAGGTLCGPWCILIGGILGAIDESLVRAGYTDKRYSTWGILGATTGSMIKPGKMSGIYGAILGILLPTDFFSEYQEVVVPVVSAAVGGVVAGPQELIIWMVGGIADELLINNGLTDVHHFTDINIGMAVSNALFKSNYLINIFIGGAIGVLLAQHENDVYDHFVNQGPIDTFKKTYSLYGKFIPQEKLEAHIEEQAIFLIAAQLLTQFLALSINKYFGDLNHNFEHLNQNGNVAWNFLKSNLLKTAFFIVPHTIGELFSKASNDYFSNRLYSELGSQLRAEIFSKKNIKSVFVNDMAKVPLDNLVQDLSTIVYSGSDLFTEAISTSTRGLYGFGIVIVSSPRIFIYFVLYNELFNSISNFLVSNKKDYENKLTSLNTEFRNIIKQIEDDIDTLIKSGEINTITENLESVSGAIQENKSMQKFLKRTNEVWGTVSGKTTSILIFYFLGSALTSGQVNFEDRSKINMGIWRLSRILSWSRDIAHLASQIDQSLNRVGILENLVHQSANQSDKVRQLPTQNMTTIPLITHGYILKAEE